MPEKCTECNSENIELIEYAHDHPEHYDGVSEIVCLDCGVRIGRWSGRILKDGEFENRYGKEK